MPRMTFTFTIWVQCLAGFAQIVMGPASVEFGWTSNRVALFHAIIGGLQTVQGILAHTYNKDGTTPSTVPQTTIHETIPQPGHGPTTITAVTEPVQRKDQ